MATHVDLGEPVDDGLLLKPETPPKNSTLQSPKGSESAKPGSSPSTGSNSSKRSRTDDESSSSPSRLGSKRVKRRAPSTISPFTSAEGYSLLYSDLRLKLPRGGDGFLDFLPNVSFVDKTPCILELPDKFRYIILRPPQFGKSAFLSTLVVYYDIRAADQFHEQFQSLAVSGQVLPHRNQHLCLWFALSSVDTIGSLAEVEEDLDSTITRTLTCFLIQYAKELNLSNPYDYLNSYGDKFGLVLDLVQASGHTLFVAIDDYDAPITIRTIDQLELFSQRPEPGEIESLLDRNFWRPLLNRSDVIEKLFVMGTFPVKYKTLQEISFSDPRSVPSFRTFCGFTEEEAFDFTRSVLKEPDLDELRRCCGKFSFPFDDGVDEPVLHPRQVMNQILKTHRITGSKPFHIVSTLLAILPGHSNKPQEASIDGLIELVGAGVVDCDVESESSSSSVLNGGAVTWRDLYYAGALASDRQSKVLRLNNSAVLELIHSSVDSIVCERHGLDGFPDTWYVSNLHKTLKPLVEAVSTILQALVRSSFGRKHEPNLPGALELLMGKSQGLGLGKRPKILFPPSGGRVQVTAYPARAPYPRAPEFPTNIHIWELKTLTLRGMWLGANPNDNDPTPEALEKLYKELLCLDEEQLLRRRYTGCSPASGAMETVEVGSLLDDDPVVPQFLSVGGRILLRVPFVEPEPEREWEEEEDGVFDFNESSEMEETIVADLRKRRVPFEDFESDEDSESDVDW
ncbi:AAA-ATPase-like domain-containing protein [Favolaschia claudopus]|uniref:AAA-ATPase-like domain-containing protein n=1 Tax=Favolaschia claudopus TaxID=2862362 RepID=A0AAW0A3I2_9AGAR